MAAGITLAFRIMKKTLLIIGVAVLVLVLATYFGGMFFLGSALRATVNSVGPRITKSKVELAGASVSPLSGSGSLIGLAVGNPAGWSGGNALYVGRVRFGIEPRSLFHPTVVIDELTIEQPEFVYETRIISSNIGDLMKNIEQAVGSNAEATPGRKEPPRKFIVKHFRLDHGKVTVGVGPAAVALPIPAIDLTDLGVAEGGLTSSQLAFAVFQQVVPNIISATTGAATTIGGTMGAAASDAVKRAGDSLQKWIGGKK